MRIDLYHRLYTIWSNLCSAEFNSHLLRRRALFLWRQEDTSSLRLFSVDSSGRQMIKNFSFRQRLHLLLELLYGRCDERMHQKIKCSMLLSLRVQMCLLSLVEFLWLAWRNDAVWFLKSDVCFCHVVAFARDGGLVNYWWLWAVSIEWTCILLSAVARLVINGSGSGGRWW